MSWRSLPAVISADRRRSSCASLNSFGTDPSSNGGAVGRASRMDSHAVSVGMASGASSASAAGWAGRRAWICCESADMASWNSTRSCCTSAVMLVPGRVGDPLLVVRRGPGESESFLSCRRFFSGKCWDTVFLGVRLVDMDPSCCCQPAPPMSYKTRYLSLLGRPLLVAEYQTKMKL
jgi:hypothetical protein